MTLLEDVIKLDAMLANDGYKSWSYARLTLDKVIKALQAPPDVNPPVMQADGSDGLSRAAFGQRSVDTLAAGRTCDKYCKRPWNCQCQNVY
jgi:hypothetical protein